MNNAIEELKNLPLSNRLIGILTGYYLQAEEVSIKIRGNLEDLKTGLGEAVLMMPFLSLLPVTNYQIY